MNNSTPNRIPKHISTALIDMDGVLYDSMPFHARAWHEMMLKQTGLNIPEEEFFEYEGMTGKATIELLFQKYLHQPITAEECRRLYAIKTDLFVAYGKKITMPGANEVLTILKQRNIRRILVTGSAQRSLLDSLNHDYPGAFAVNDMVTALDVKHGKPHPEPYLQGLKKGACRASEAIVIENAPLGIEAGKAAGCFVAAVATGPIAHDKLFQAGADVVFESMHELAHALKES